MLIKNKLVWLINNIYKAKIEIIILINKKKFIKKILLKSFKYKKYKKYKKNKKNKKKIKL